MNGNNSNKVHILDFLLVVGARGKVVDAFTLCQFNRLA